MDFYDVIEKRHCFRGTFSNQTVSRETLKRIVQAGLLAPSGCNAQTTSFVIVNEPELLQKIAGLLNKPVCSSASAMIVCLTEKKEVFQGMSFEREDCAAAVENILLAITAEGLASVWLDGVLRMNSIAEKIGQLLNIPSNKKVQILLPVGVPSEPVAGPAKQTFEERVQFNRY